MMGSPQHTTLSSQPPWESVTITHPHHPLNGQQVTVIRIRRGADPDLVVRLPDGTHAAIAMSLTDYAATPEAELPVAATHLLELDGLRQVVQLLDRLRAEGRFPIAERSTGPDRLAEARYD